MFRVTDLKQFVYCARIVYYTYCLPLLRPVTFKMVAGVEAHDRAEGLEQRRSLRASGLTSGQRYFDVALESEALGLRGKVDMVVREDGEVIPVEYKDSPGRMGRNLELQLAAYGLMLEEMGWGRVGRGFLYFIPTRRAREVRLTEEMKGEVRAMCLAMGEMVEREHMPPPTPYRARCRACEFRRFCNDIEL
mgnify:CR=1 FL=1